MNDTTTMSANCECGALSVNIEGPPVVQLICHCSDCQAVTGLPYFELAFFTPNACHADGDVHSITMQGGTGSDKTHYACAKCATPLYGIVSVLNGAVAVAANRISSFNFEPQAHIWTSEKVDEILIPEGIAHTAEGPPKDIVDIMVASFWGKE